MSLSALNPPGPSLSLLDPDKNPFRCAAALGPVPSSPFQCPWPLTGPSATGCWGPCSCCPCSGRTRQSQHGLHSQKWPEQGERSQEAPMRPEASCQDTGLDSQGSCFPWAPRPGALLPLGDHPRLSSTWGSSREGILMGRRNAWGAVGHGQHLQWWDSAGERL